MWQSLGFPWFGSDSLRMVTHALYTQGLSMRSRPDPSRVDKRGFDEFMSELCHEELRYLCSFGSNLLLHDDGRRLRELQGVMATVDEKAYAAHVQPRFGR